MSPSADKRQSRGAGERRERDRRPPLRSPEESERDLPLKARMRRLFWSMGCSTSVDVKLRAYVTGDQRGSAWQEFTDLDVLGVGFSPGGHLQLMLADCKTVNRRVVERMFWLRGVADFFAADEAYLVRSHPVPAAARALSTRLGVGVLDPDDYEALARTHPAELDFEGPLRWLFDLDALRYQTDNTVGLDRKLDPLVDFLRFDYWIYEPHRNLTQVVAHLAAAVATLEPANPRHLGLFYEAAWLYAFAVARATQHVRASRMADVPTAVRAYVAGGELAMREKAQLAGLLEQVGIPVDVRAAVLPPYVDSLIELVASFVLRPSEMPEVLRYAEYLTAAVLVGERATVREAFGPSKVRPLAAKLLADVCGFLVGAAGLRLPFRTAARERLVVDLTGGQPVSPPSAPPATDLACGDESVRQRPLSGELVFDEPPDGSPEPT